MPQAAGAPRPRSRVHHQRRRTFITNHASFSLSCSSLEVSQLGKRTPFIGVAWIQSGLS